MFHKSAVRPARSTLVLAAAFAASIGCAKANVVVHVDKNQQRMTVEVDGVPRYEWAVSTGRAGYGTPNGTYHPERLERVWFSKEYYDSPMPYSIFFSRGFAIHGSYEISHLGGPASHGCIRLHPSHAAKLFALVKEEGAGSTTIVVLGSNPPGHREVREARARPRGDRYAPAGSWWGYNRPYSSGYGYGYGYGTGAYPGYQSYPSYSRGWYGSFGY